MIRTGGRARRGHAAVVVGCCVRDTVLVVGCGGASLVVERRGRGTGAGLRVVVGSQSQWARGEAAVVTGAFVVGRPVTDAAPTIGGCGSGRVVACRPVHSVSASGRGGTLETGCVGCSMNRVVCDRVTICSGSGGVVA